MQTFKGLIALLLVALVVFAFAARNDVKSLDRYAAKINQPARAGVLAMGKPAATGKSGKVAKAAGKIGNPATNIVRQARQTGRRANF